MLHRTSIALFAFLCLTRVAAADHEDKTGPLPGHSVHGEAFNEGPRQKAYLMPGMGPCKFPATTKIADAQAFINQGVNQLHGFWYFEAERSFRQAAALDPDCATAYWGMAMANINNGKRAKEFIEQASKRKDKASEREKLYIDALHAYHNSKQGDKEKRQALIRTLETIVEKFPDDLEAKAFLVFYLWDSRGPLPIVSNQAVDAMMQLVLAKEPMHPVHHYRIHLWDGDRASIAVTSANKSGQSSPGIAHMWHMGGHIFDKLGRYGDAAWQQEASARVDHGHMMHDLVLPDQIHNYAHNNEWLCRNLMHVGRVSDALSLAKNMVELPRHPKFNTLDRGSASYGRQRLVDLLESYELWDEFLASADAYLPPRDDASRMRLLRIRGVALIATSKLAEAEKLIDEIESFACAAKAEQKNEADEAAAKAREEKAAKDAKKERPKAETTPAPTPTPTKNEGKENKGAKDSKTPAPVTPAPVAPAPSAAPAPTTPVPVAPVTPQPSTTAPASQKTPAPAAVPPAPAKPAAPARNDESRKKRNDAVQVADNAAAELRGHLLIARGKADEGIKLIEQAKDTPRPRQALAYLAAGNKAKAEELARAEAGGKSKQVGPQAVLAYVLWQCDKKKEAVEAFTKLREMSSELDLSANVFKRLAPIAQELTLPADWRAASKAGNDLGNRPPLESLGPFRWSPTPAAAFKLTDSQGKTVSLSDYQGKPVVVIFYLGSGCVHCTEQLATFAPMTKDFTDAGIAVIGISTDNPSDLKLSMKPGPDGAPFPFPIVSDDKLAAFHAYRCFDDFEKKTLHGTFFIDGSGLIRWHDISYQPFMDAKFVLGEAKRLLALPSPGAKTQVAR